AYVGFASSVAIPSTNVLTFFEDDFVSRGFEAVPGSVDYLAVYNRPLTAAEVTNLTVNPPGTIPVSVDVNQAAVVVSEGDMAIDTGTWTSAVSLSASVGTVTQNTDGT